MALAYGTPTATPSGQKAIQQFAIGDLILAGSPAGNSPISWKPLPVSFSSGKGTGSGQLMMAFITCGENSSITCTTDHPFLLADGTIKRAARLVRDADRLVDVDGNPVDILDISIGSYMGGVHAVATDITYNGSLDRHLLLTAGVVTGDYCLEIYLGKQLEKESAAGESDAESPAPLAAP
jgi:hypothetical protein